MAGAGSPPEGQPHSSGPAPHSCPFPWPQHPCTCWKESSKSVCRDTLIFTWLGRALDCRQGKSTKARGCVRLARLPSPTPAHRAQGTHTAAHSCSTHVAEEAELVVLPAKAPVVRARGAAVFAPAKAAGPRHTPCPEQPPAPAGCSSPLCQSPHEPPVPLFGAYPDSKPGRGSLKVVVRVLWSTKYRTLSLVYFISQPGGSGGSWIILLAREGSPDRPSGSPPLNYSSVPGQRKDSRHGTGERLFTPGHGTVRASLSICGTHGPRAGHVPGELHLPKPCSPHSPLPLCARVFPLRGPGVVVHVIHSPIVLSLL